MVLNLVFSCNYANLSYCIYGNKSYLHCVSGRKSRQVACKLDWNREVCPVRFVELSCRGGQFICRVGWNVRVREHDLTHASLSCHNT